MRCLGRRAGRERQKKKGQKRCDDKQRNNNCACLMLLRRIIFYALMIWIVIQRDNMQIFVMICCQLPERKESSQLSDVGKRKIHLLSQKIFSHKTRKSSVFSSFSLQICFKINERKCAKAPDLVLYYIQSDFVWSHPSLHNCFWTQTLCFCQIDDF